MSVDRYAHALLDAQLQTILRQQIGEGFKPGDLVSSEAEMGVVRDQPH